MDQFKHKQAYNKVFFTIFLCGLSLTAFNQATSLGDKADEEDLPIIMNSQSVTSKDIRSKANIFSNMPFQFFQKTIGVAYERVFNKHGIMPFYYYVSKEKTHDMNLQYHYYFKESKLKDFNFDQIHITGFYMEYFTGISLQYAFSPLADRYSVRVPLGARVQFKKGLNIALTGMLGPSFQKTLTKEEYFLSNGFIFGIGYRF